MLCPFCSHPDTQVIETRDSDEGDAIRRRRRCNACDKRFTTYERPEIELPSIVKRDGRRTPFDRSKLAESLALALRKRPVTTEAVDAAIHSIEMRLMQSGEREIDSTQLGEWVMSALRKLDKVAYVRFASVYRKFDDVSEFVDAINETGKTNQKKSPSP